MIMAVSGNFIQLVICAYQQIHGIIVNSYILYTIKKDSNSLWDCIYI